jgi:hypothetical protein
MVSSEWILTVLLDHSTAAPIMDIVHITQSFGLQFIILQSSGTPFPDNIMETNATYCETADL